MVNSYDEIVDEDGETGIHVLVARYGTRLANRSRNQTDGKFSAEEFCKKILYKVIESYKKDPVDIELNFVGVTTLSPSWANEVVGYFASRFPNWDRRDFYYNIQFHNLSKVKFDTFWTEVETVFGHE